MKYEPSPKQYISSRLVLNFTIILNVQCRDASADSGNENPTFFFVKQIWIRSNIFICQVCFVDVLPEPGSNSHQKYL